MAVINQCFEVAANRHRVMATVGIWVDTVQHTIAKVGSKPEDSNTLDCTRAMSVAI